MAVTILEKPHTIAFSRNPVNYALITDTALTTPGLTIEVKLLFQPFTGGGTNEVIIFPLTPDNTGKAQIDFKKILDSLVSYTLPSFDIAVQKAFSQAGYYSIEYREITSADPSPAWIQEDALSHVVIKGGLPYERWQGANFFVNFDYAEKPWLTWQPSGRECAIWEKMWLTYFHMTTHDNDYVVKYNVKYTDGTENESMELLFPLGSPVYCGIYRIPVGVEQLGLQALDPLKKIYYYQVRLYKRVPGTGDIPVATPYVFYVDYTIDYQLQQFNYFNSLGALDSVRIKGEIEKVIEYERDIAENNPGHEYYISENLVPMKFTQQVLEEVSFKGNIGWMDAAKTQDLLRDLLLSKQVHQIKYNRWWPVNITTKAADMGALITDKRDLPIDWTYGFTNESYAPEWVQLGGMPVCPIVTGLAATVLDLATASINWNVAAGLHITFNVEVVLASGDIMSTYYNVSPPINISRLGPKKRVRVRANCGFANSGWTNLVIIP